MVDVRGQLLKMWGKYFGTTDDAPEVEETQTARIGSIKRDFEEHPSMGLTPSKLVTIFRSAEEGDLVNQNDLFEDMEEKDANIFCEMSKRKRALINLEWDLVPPLNASDAEKKQTAQIKEWIKSIENFEDVLFDMGDAIGKGFSNHEYDGWHPYGKVLIPKIVHRPARWFQTGMVERDRILLRTEDGQGEPLWQFGWLSHVHKAKSGYVARSGLFRVLAWPYLFKNYSIRDLAEFLEIYGLPIRLGKYPSGATDKEKSTLLSAVVNIGHNAAGIIPEGMSMEFKEAAKGQADPFKTMMDWADAAESKAILGGTLTSTASNTGLGSNTAQVHDDVRHDLMESDARQFEGTLTRDLVMPLALLNIRGMTPDRVPRFKFDTQEAEDIKMYSDALPKLVGIGMQIPANWARKRLRIPEAEDGEDVLTPAINAPLLPAATRLAMARHQPGHVDVADDFAERLQNEAGVAMEQIIDRVRQLLDEVDTLEEFETRLIEIYSFLDPEDLTDVIQFGLSAADLAGRFEVNDGN